MVFEGTALGQAQALFLCIRDTQMMYEHSALTGPYTAIFSDANSVAPSGHEIHRKYTNFIAYQVLTVPISCDCCLLGTYRSSIPEPFHGGNTGSNPVGDANFIN